MAFTELPLRKKVSTKLFILTTIWWLGALLAIFFTLSLLWQLEGAGGAINDAGSLRMRVYRLVILDQSDDKVPVLDAVEDFTNVLTGIVEGDPKRPLMLPQEDHIYWQAESVLRAWKDQILPNLIENDGTPFTYEEANAFISEIDALVKMVEKSNASTLKRLHFYQDLLIILVVAGSLTMLYILFHLIIRPLQRLNYALSLAEKGDFSYRETLNNREDEFGLLSIGYNKMATRLEALYRGMEETIEEQTQDLKQRNSELESLYTITSYLHNQHDIKIICEGFLASIMPIVHADAGAIRLHDYNDQKMKLIAEVNLSEDLQNSVRCQHFDHCYCGKFAQTESISEEMAIQDLLEKTPPCQEGAFKALNIFPIFYDQEKIGIVTLFSHDGKAFSEAKKNLLNSLSNQLGVAIGGVRLMERSRKMAVLEERNIFAQDLHDSIAQILNFLNWQVQMLEKAIKNGHKEEARENLAFIKDGVKESYENVRQLLLNFRTPLRLESFSYHLEELIKRFKTQTEIEVNAMVDASNIHLSDKEKLEVVFIIQEALSNIRKHANATKVSLQIYTDEKNYIIRVTDNGQGFAEEILTEKSLEHVGILIMEERAQKIGGQLAVLSEPGEGTELRLIIPRKEAKAEHE